MESVNTPISAEAVALLQWLRDSVIASLYAAETVEQAERAAEQLLLVEEAMLFAARQQMTEAGLL